MIAGTEDGAAWGVCDLETGKADRETGSLKHLQQAFGAVVAKNALRMQQAAGRLEQLAVMIVEGYWCWNVAADKSAE